MDNDDLNEYKTPESVLENTEKMVEELQYIGPQKRPSGNGLDWISHGFKIFSKSPGPWILTMIVGFVIMMVIGMIPIIGSIFSALTTYVWIAGLIIGCKAIDDGGKMDIKYLFAGFSIHVWKLIGLSVLMALISLVVMFAAMGSIYLDIFFGNAEQLPEDLDILSLALRGLIVMALLIPLMMAVWFAPALIVLQNMSLIESMKASIAGCIKNFVPFLIYGVIMLVLLFIAALPLMLGLLVLAPVGYASIYCSYKDIYLQHE